MPGGKGFVSEKQRRFMWVKHPQIAKRWQKETGGRKLPMRSHKKA